MKYEIYQIKDIENCNYSFMWWLYAKQKFNFNDYKKVYEGQIECNDIDETLGKLFDIFNIKHPQDFKGHSMSVSDIVKLDGRYYYVDSIGFQEVEV